MAKTDTLEFNKEKQGYSCEFTSVGKCVIQIDREKSGHLVYTQSWKEWIIRYCINTHLFHSMII